MKHVVKSEFVDANTGTRYFPAARGADPVTFAPRDDEQRERLISAGVLSKEAVSAVPAKPLGEMSRFELEEAVVFAFRAKLSDASDEDLRTSLERYLSAADAGADEKEPATEDEIRTAIDLLDHANEKHWTQAGLPEVSAVADLLDGKTVNRAAIKAAAPDAKRKVG